MNNQKQKEVEEIVGNQPTTPNPNQPGYQMLQPDHTTTKCEGV